ncbi:substrate-binding domain-containing protein, partial [uncultured Thermanaerothrix sp.]|uniref:substrate-binding domain-containing protein n=1 Tax=uncultured Thermanaerothrix sp. TaxID=1195149 RepID=UPI00344F341B
MSQRKFQPTVWLVSLLVIVAMILTACGGQPTAAPTKPAGEQPATQPPAGGEQPTKKFTIGISNPFVGSEWRSQMIKDLQEVNAEYMAQGLTNELIIESYDTDVQGQIQQIRNLMNKGVDAIIVN